MSGTLAFSQLVNEKAEQAVIGCMLLRNEEIPRVSDVLETTDFHFHNNQLVSRLIFEAHKKGCPVDAVTVGAILGPEMGNAKAAVVLLDQILEAVPNPWHAVHYAEIVKDLSDRRKVFHLCRKLLRKLPDRKFSVRSMLDRFQELTERGMK